jgi:hypothetical protein
MTPSPALEELHRRFDASSEDFAPSSHGVGFAQHEVGRLW